MLLMVINFLRITGLQNPAPGSGIGSKRAKDAAVGPEISREVAAEFSWGGATTACEAALRLLQTTRYSMGWQQVVSGLRDNGCIHLP